MVRSIPESERILVFQGGGSLGAYEAGAYKGIYELLKKKDNSKSIYNKSTFDIIAGSSIGAINATILTSHVIETGSYDGSTEKLIDFWHYLSKESMVEKNPFFEEWWNFWHSIYNHVASGEAARRYYSSKEFSLFGVPNVFTPMTPQSDTKFFDIQNTWYRFDIKPLKRSLERFAKFPIATEWEDGQPRLLLISVDVATSYQAVFDSYKRKDGTRCTEYGRHIRKHDGTTGFEYVIHYDEGITSDHVIASAAFPVNFDYVNLNVQKYDVSQGNQIISNETKIDKLESNEYKIQQRKFWDGGLMNNTPLMSAIQKHRDYWYYTRGIVNNIPSLGIAIVNLHPSAQEEIPIDHDGVLNRNNDITFSDRSITEEGYLLLISDYVDLVKQFIDLLIETGIKKEKIDSILDSKVRPHGMFSKIRTYRNIVEGRFNITDVIRIERKNDEDTISNKTYDFSSKTINELLKQGYFDSIEYAKRNQQDKNKDDISK